MKLVNQQVTENLEEEGTVIDHEKVFFHRAAGSFASGKGKKCI